MMRRHYAATLGPGFEDRYEPPPLPRWLRRARGGLRGGQEARAGARRRSPVSSSDASDSDGGSGDENASVSSTRRASPDSERARRAAQPRETPWRPRDGRPVALGRGVVARERGPSRRVVDRRLARAEPRTSAGARGAGSTSPRRRRRAVPIEGAARRAGQPRALPRRRAPRGSRRTRSTPRARAGAGAHHRGGRARPQGEARAQRAPVRELHAVRGRGGAPRRGIATSGGASRQKTSVAPPPSPRACGLAAERAAAAAAAAAAAMSRAPRRRWRRVRAVGNFVRRKALGTGREGKPAGEHEREAKRGPHEST